MKKTIIAPVIIVIVTVILGVALATGINWNPNIHTGYSYYNEHDGTWTYSDLKEKYSFEEVKHMAQEHDVYWMIGKNRIAIEMVKDEWILVFEATDELLSNCGPYKLWL